MRAGERPARLFTSRTVTTRLHGARDLRKRVTAIYWGQVVQTEMIAYRLGVCPAAAQLSNDDSSDDNRDDTGPLNYAPYSPKIHLSCLVMAPACSWQCGGQGFESP
jgi:hypothetical protein